MNESMVEMLECPICHGSMKKLNDTLECLECNAIFPLIDGIPVLLKSKAINKQVDDDYLNKINPEYESITFYDDVYKDFNDLKRYNNADIIFTKRFFEKYKLKKDSIILDLAAGTGYYGKLIEDYTDLTVFCSDFSIVGFQTAKIKYNLKNLFLMDAYRLAFKPNTIDMVFSLGLTPFKKTSSNEIEQLIKQVCYPLKSGGLFVFGWATNLSGCIEEGTNVNIKAIKNFDYSSKFYNHNRKTIIKAFENTELFSEIDAYIYLKPLSFLLGNLMFSKFVTYSTELLMKFMPKTITARLWVIGKLK